MDNKKIPTHLGTIVIAIIAITAGMFVWQYEKNMPVDLAQSAVSVPVAKKPTQPVATQSASTTPAVNQNYIEVKELGFKISVDSSLAGELLYKIVKPEGIDYPLVEFSSKIGRCDAGTISKISGTPAKNITGEAEFYEGRMANIKQFDGFFLFYQHPQAVSCDAKYADTEKKMTQVVSDSLKNASLIDGLDKNMLQNIVTSAVNDVVVNRQKTTWDKKVTIDSIDISQKAAKGFWWAKDRWDWIAWQKDDGSWNVLVSADGFSCKELESVPSQYADFFKDVTYQSGKKYCY